MNELKEICYRLDNYGDSQAFEIIKAEKTGDTWVLTVKALNKDGGAANESN